MKNPHVAAALNIIPGLGYLYLNRKVHFGGLLLFGTILITLASAYNPSLAPYAEAPLTAWDAVSSLGLLLIIAGFVTDAYREALTLNATSGDAPTS